jgi:hypothetical protein
MNDFSKVAGYKTNMQKPIVFLYISNENNIKNSPICNRYKK